jgi:hypothetical protein
VFTLSLINLLTIVIEKDQVFQRMKIESDQDHDAVENFSLMVTHFPDTENESKESIIKKLNEENKELDIIDFVK